MRTLVAISSDTKGHTSGNNHARPKPTSLAQPRSGDISLQRKPSCACGGACPRCKAIPSPLSTVRLGQPGDLQEREADALADRLVAGEAVAVGGRSGSALHAKRSGASLGRSPGIDGLGSGQQLPMSVQKEFGPRLGHDLSQVRIHTSAAAHTAVASVGARAFTLGRDLVFGAGEFAPGAAEGRRLIAHELVHWVQQGGRVDRVQRLLKIDAPASDDKTTAIPQMTPLLGKLCPDFDVDAKSGDVTAKSGSDCAKGTFGGVAGGKHPLGCCCLCTLARAPAQWKIAVTITGAPTTDTSGRLVKMTPTSGASVPDLRYWTGGPKEKMANLPPEDALGHELCGHAALSQANAHPPGEDQDTARTFSDIHDPTVKIENKLAGAGEMALGSPPRGLAGSASHRGESLRVFVVGSFTAGDATISKAAQASIDGAAAFADGNARLLIDIVGFREASDKVAGISKTRADAVRAALDGKMTKKADVDFTTSKGATPTSIPRLQPATDGGVGPNPVVEIRLAREPAGLEALPSGVTLPSPPVHVGPEKPAVVDLVIKKGKSTGNACHDLLIKTAWT
jgi:hypothetical protein